MNTKLDNYMNDIEIIDEHMPLREIHAIRLMMYDETKDMTFEERNAYFKEGIDDICKEFNIKLVPCTR